MKVPFWKEHGTKILGGLVIAVGALGAASAQIREILPPQGDLVFDLFKVISDYVVAATGLGVMVRGFTNSAATKDVQNPDEQSKP